MKKDFLSVGDLARDEILELFRRTDSLKRLPVGRQLADKTVSLIFEKPSTRTRISFEAGIGQLGGRCIYIDAATTQLARGETIEDTARIMERYVDCIVARLNSHSTILAMAKVTRIPVVNALSDLEHPCQALADLYTIREKMGKLQGVKVCYLGDGNNVCNSLIYCCAILGLKISVATPEGYEPEVTILKKASELSGDLVKLSHSPEEAAQDADIIYTDTFVSMGSESERAQRLSRFVPKYTVTDSLFEFAQSRALFMHCLPAHRGEEVSAEVIDGPRSIVFDQAENRMHVQKQLLIELLSKGKNR